MYQCSSLKAEIDNLLIFITQPLCFMIQLQNKTTSSVFIGKIRNKLVQIRTWLTGGVVSFSKTYRKF